MVFSHNSSASPAPPADPEVKPRRGGVVHAPELGKQRLVWRAIVHVRDRDSVQHTEWHLATCSNVTDEAAHCPEGRRLMSTVGEPDGHCMVGRRCGRCKAAG